MDSASSAPPAPGSASAGSAVIAVDAPTPLRDNWHHLHIYRGGRGDPEATKGYALAHTWERAKIDVEFEADFGKGGRVKGRFASGPPVHRGAGLPVSCEQR